MNAAFSSPHLENEIIVPQKKTIQHNWNPFYK